MRHVVLLIAIAGIIIAILMGGLFIIAWVLGDPVPSYPTEGYTR